MGVPAVVSARTFTRFAQGYDAGVNYLRPALSLELKEDAMQDQLRDMWGSVVAIAPKLLLFLVILSLAGLWPS